MDSLITHNGSHPYELQAVSVCERHFKKCHWPFERLPLRISFGLRKCASQSKINAELKQGRLYGNASLFLNYLFLAQDEACFYAHVIPHEIAHLLANAESLRDGTDIKEHGLEWRNWLQRVNSATSKKTIPPGRYRYLAIGIYKGEKILSCKCDSENRFIALSAKSLESGDKSCNKCKAYYELIDYDRIPASIQADLDYITQEETSRI